MAPSFTTQTSDFNNHNMMASHDSFTYADEMMQHTDVDSNTAWKDRDSVWNDKAHTEALVQADMERWAMEMSNNVDEITYNRTVTPQAEVTTAYGGITMVTVPWMAPGQIVTVTMGGVSSEYQVMSVDQTQDGTTLNVNIQLQPVAHPIDITFDLALDPEPQPKVAYSYAEAEDHPWVPSEELPWIPSQEELDTLKQAPTVNGHHALSTWLKEAPTDLDGGTPLLPQVFGNHVVPPKMYDPLDSFDKVSCNKALDKAMKDELVGRQNEALIKDINKQWSSMCPPSASQDMATKPRPK